MVNELVVHHEPCPFCGSERVIAAQLDDGTVFVRCIACRDTTIAPSGDTQ